MACWSPRSVMSLWFLNDGRVGPRVSAYQSQLRIIKGYRHRLHGAIGSGYEFALLRQSPAVSSPSPGIGFMRIVLRRNMIFVALQNLFAWRASRLFHRGIGGW